MADKTKKKTWVSILIAAIIIAGILVVAVIGGSAYFISRHIRAQVLSSDGADARFESMRGQFAGQVPLIEMTGDGDDPIVHRPPPSADRTPIAFVRVMAYSPDSGKLVNVSLPLWILRLAPREHLFGSFGDAADFDGNRVHFTLEDLERHGPGLILDARNRGGSRVLIWAE